MGCDIHFYVERRIEGAWVTADKWGQGKYDEPGESSRLHPFYDGRSYDLFAILADVRNGHGFAGIKTGEGFIPMFAPRGVPDDACPEYKAEVAKWNGDGHSHSWVTLAEVLAYDWTEKTIKQGWVGIQEWARWAYRSIQDDPDEQGPESWSGSIGGGNTRHLKEADFRAAWEALRKERDLGEFQMYQLAWDGDRAGLVARMLELLGGGSPICEVSWTIPYYVAGRSFLGRTVPRLLRLGAPDDVRCTFFFDN